MKILSIFTNKAAEQVVDTEPTIMCFSGEVCDGCNMCMGIDQAEKQMQDALAEQYAKELAYEAAQAEDYRRFMWDEYQEELAYANSEHIFESYDEAQERMAAESALYMSMEVDEDIPF